jgi:hypothetical protein
MIDTDPLRSALQRIIEADQRPKHTTVEIDPAGNTIQIEMVDGSCAVIARAALAAAPRSDADALREAPVAWIVLSTDADQIRIWWRDEEPAKAWAARHGLPLIPLYAKPFSAADFLALPPAAPLREVAWRYRAKDQAEHRAWSYTHRRRPDEMNGWEVQSLYAATAAPALDRAAIIKECAKAAQNFETKRHWSDDPDMQNQAYYTEGEVAHEIATTILALASAHQPAAIDKAASDKFAANLDHAIDVLTRPGDK